MVKKNNFWLIVVFFIFHKSAICQRNSTVKEHLKVYKTYDFSDPDPIPDFVKIYPYFRFDGFTDTPVDKKWKVVTLENEFLIVDILPEIGGKVWSAYDKINKKYFIYNNEVVKFRDISMRGPWTSGGIEFNYGVLGHTPNTATPVNYVMKQNNDGSVSCIIGSFEMLTRTRWNVEIKLEKDKAYFTTTSFWHNSTSEDQPYYQWTNSAVYAKKDLQLIYPGTAAIGHSGNVLQWPYDSVKQKNISNWIENNFDGSKSFHIVGSHKSYFGALWKDENFGMIRYSERDEKLGRKFFSWALSGQGSIWEDLLTDKDGQYIEMQSGRLFNQNSISSSLTPFKQTSFVPYGTDVWREYWYSFAGTNGVTDANEFGVISLKAHKLIISPLQFINDTLIVIDGNDKIVHKAFVNLKPMKTVVIDLLGENTNLQNAVVTIAGKNWTINDQELERPLIAPKDFDRNSAFGLYLYARDLAWLKNYADAEPKAVASIRKDENFIPSLVLLSHLMYRKMNYDSAFYYAKKALSIDTYDAKANYYYGLAARKLNKKYDALDGFEVAALTTEYRSAAYTEMSKIYLSELNYDKSFEYAEKSMRNNMQNVEGLQLQYLINRIRNKDVSGLIKKIESIEALNYFLLFEKYWNNKSEIERNRFVSSIRDEMPYQTFLELAIWYHSLNRNDEANQVLNLAPQNLKILYWKAFLNQKTFEGNQFLDTAKLMSADFIFPFREESEEVLLWVSGKTTDWKPRYFLALLNASRNNKEKAQMILDSINIEVPYAPFYIVRASLNINASLEKNLKLSVKYGNNSWRYYNYLSRYYLSKHNYEEALNVIEPFYKKNPGNYVSGMLYVRTLMRNNQYEQANAVLKDLKVLPFEGAGEGRRLYEETKLVLALNEMQKNNYAEALKYLNEAREWPANMGVGKPYDNLIDARPEDFFEALVMHQSGQVERAKKLFEKVANDRQSVSSNNTLLQIAALNYLNKNTDADSLFAAWKQFQKNEDVMALGLYFADPSAIKKIDFSRYKSFLRMISEKEDSRLF